VISTAPADSWVEPETAAIARRWQPAYVGQGVKHGS